MCIMHPPCVMLCNVYNAHTHTFGQGLDGGAFDFGAVPGMPGGPGGQAGRPVVVTALPPPTALRRVGENLYQRLETGPR
jgi:hypothetical protein